MTSRFHDTKTLSLIIKHIPDKMASLLITSLISFFAEEKKSIRTQIGSCGVTFVSTRYFKREVHASMKYKVYKVKTEGSGFTLIGA